MAYSILLRPAAVRDLNALPSDMRTRIEKSIEEQRQTSAAALTMFHKDGAVTWQAP